MKKKLLGTLALCSLLTLSSASVIGLTGCSSETGSFVTNNETIKGNVLNAKLFVSYTVNVKLGGEKDAIKVTIDNPKAVKVRASGKTLIVKAVTAGTYKLSASLVSDPNKKIELVINAVNGEESYKLQVENTTTSFKKGQTFQAPNIEVFKKLFVDGIETDTYDVLSKKDFTLKASKDGVVVSEGESFVETGTYKVSVEAAGSETFTYDITVAENDAYSAILYFDEIMKGNYTLNNLSEGSNGALEITPTRFVTLDYVVDGSTGFGYMDQGGSVRKFAIESIEIEENKYEYKYTALDNVFKGVNEVCTSLTETEKILGYESTTNFNRAWLDDIKLVESKDGKSSYSLTEELSMFLLKLYGYKYAEVNFTFKDATLVIDEQYDVPFGIIMINVLIPVSQTEAQLLSLPLLFTDIGLTIGPKGVDEFVFSDFTPDLECKDPIIKTVLDGIGNGNFTANTFVDGEDYLTLTFNENYIDIAIPNGDNIEHQGYVAANKNNYNLLAEGVYTYGAGTDKETGKVQWQLGQAIPGSDGSFTGLGREENGVFISLSPDLWQGFGCSDLAKQYYNLPNGFYSHWNDIGVVNALPAEDDPNKLGYLVYEYNTYNYEIALALVSGLFYLDVEALASNGIELKGAYIDTTLKVVDPVAGDLELTKITMGLTVSIPGELGDLVLEFPGLEASISNLGTAKDADVDKFLSQYIETIA